MFSLSRRAGDRNILFFTVHKAASMFIYKVCQDLSKAAGLPYYSINHNRQSRYYFDTEAGHLEDIANWGGRTGCFAPLRYSFAIPQALNARIILHLRDPRDVLVSLYYSEAYSHGFIKGVFELARAEREAITSRGIDQFVLGRAEEFNRKYDEYRDLLSWPDATFVKYEDLVLDLPRWLAAVARPFAIEKPPQIAKICKKYKHEFEIRPENIYAHKRKILPGDYKEKLQPETIRALNRIFHDNLQAYAYEQ